MQQVTATMPPALGAHQSLPTGPFPTPLGNAPRIKPPATPPAMKRAPSTAILIGEAGANLVLSRLQGWRIPAQPAMPGVAYDLIADVPGLGMVRIQVKTKSSLKGQRCSFSLTRGFYYSKAGMFRYAEDDYDIAAFACLSFGQVFFCVAPIARISVSAAWLRSPGVARETFDLALRSLVYRRHSEALSWGASMTPDLPPATPQAPSWQASFNL